MNLKILLVTAGCLILPTIASAQAAKVASRDPDCPKGCPTSTGAAGLTGIEFLALQQELRDQGCGTTQVTGILDAPTRRAIATCSRKHNASNSARAMLIAFNIGFDEEPDEEPPPAPPPPPPPPRTASPPPPVRQQLPQFPWPVPPPTTQLIIARRLLTAATTPLPAADRLGDLADKIEQALSRASLDFAVYAIGDSGFAYVTKVEMIRRDGRFMPAPDRFPNDVESAAPGGGFLDFITSRFFARPGFFRVIAIVVTNRTIATGATSLTVDAATRLANGGMLTLPPVLRNMIVRDLQFLALVYEYQRPSASGLVALRSSPLVPARDHLARAGLWTTAELRAAP